MELEPILEGGDQEVGGSREEVGVLVRGKRSSAIQVGIEGQRRRQVWRGGDNDDQSGEESIRFGNMFQRKHY